MKGRELCANVVACLGLGMTAAIGVGLYLNRAEVDWAEIGGRALGTAFVTTVAIALLWLGRLKPPA